MRMSKSKYGLDEEHEENLLIYCKINYFIIYVISFGIGAFCIFTTRLKQISYVGLIKLK